MIGLLNSSRRTDPVSWGWFLKVLVSKECAKKKLAYKSKALPQKRLVGNGCSGVMATDKSNTNTVLHVSSSLSVCDSRKLENEWKSISSFLHLVNRCSGSWRSSQCRFPQTISHCCPYSWKVNTDTVVLYVNQKEHSQVFIEYQKYVQYFGR